MSDNWHHMSSFLHRKQDGWHQVVTQEVLSVNRGNRMASKQNKRITVRLPVKIINAIDMFIQAGESSSRSDVIRRAIWRLLSDEGDNVMKNLEKINKLNESHKFEEFVEKEYNSK